MHKYRYWYWVLVSLEISIIGYWILGAFLGIVLTLPKTSMAESDVYKEFTVVARLFTTRLLTGNEK